MVALDRRRENTFAALAAGDRRLNELDFSGGVKAPSRHSVPRRSGQSLCSIASSLSSARFDAGEFRSASRLIRQGEDAARRI
jgi:hypothetical protein